MPLSVLGRFVDPILDASVVFSFDRTGFERHSRRFDPDDLDVDLAGRRMLVTGANSGLGRAAALRLADLGAEVWMLCRSRERGETAREEIRLATGNDTVRLEIVDVSERSSIEAFVERLGDRPVDVLLHNAGILPDERRETSDGIESTWATNVAGPFLLTWRLVQNLARARGRVILVSSGGMYAQSLDLEGFVSESERDFDGVAAYAHTKRAEVILAELWAEALRPANVVVHSMHPGWADTPAVREALPRFYALTENRLRDTRQGADTMVWLAAAEAPTRATGKFFFDRREAPTHVFPWTRESEADRRRLWRLCREQMGIDGDPLDELPNDEIARGA